MTENGLFAAKCFFRTKFIEFGGKAYSSEGGIQVPQRVEGLINSCRPETGGEFMLFVQAVSLMRTSLIALAEVVGPLCAMLDELLAGKTRTKRVVAEQGDQGGLDGGQAGGVGRPKEVPQKSATLAYSKDGWEVLMSPDGHDLYWGCFITQISPEDLYGVKAVEDMPMSHWRSTAD